MTYAPTTTGSLALALALGCTACGAVFPRYTTATRPPPAAVLASGQYTLPPDTVQRVAFVDAVVPLHRLDGRPWDDADGPDVYGILYRNGVEVYRTPVRENTVRPAWPDAAVVLYVTGQARLRFELWDRDGLLDEVIATGDSWGVPSSAMREGAWQLELSGGAVLHLRASVPPPLFGLGLTYEVHDDELRVLDVVANGPAAAAGLRVGDRITAIDGRSVQDLGEIGARQALDRGALRDVELTLVQGDRAPTQVRLRCDAVYPAR